MAMKEISAAELRDMIADVITSSIDTHRASREVSDERYTRPSGPATDEEVDDFLYHNPLLDEETREQLVDPGLLGFFAKRAHATPEWIAEFKDNLSSWAENQSWLAADLPWVAVMPRIEPSKSELWIPGASPQPGWLSTTPAALVLAANLLRDGKLLSEMKWRDFEELIGALLEDDGWTVTVTQPSRDGGFDVLAVRSDSILGEIRSVWQAKKYGPTNKVKLNEVRELSAVRDEERATKAMIVTTSRLTRDAIDWVKRDLYRLGYKDHEQIKKWIEGVILGTE